MKSDKKLQYNSAALQVKFNPRRGVARMAFRPRFGFRRAASPRLLADSYPRGANGQPSFCLPALSLIARLLSAKELIALFRRRSLET